MRGELYHKWPPVLMAQSLRPEGPVEGLLEEFEAYREGVFYYYENVRIIPPHLIPIAWSRALTLYLIDDTRRTIAAIRASFPDERGCRQ